VLRIYDVTGETVKKAGITRVALLGTKYTMEEPFYRNALEQKYGIEVVTPNLSERDYINTVIFDELCRNDIRENSRTEFVSIINRLADDVGAQGVILGCTEIPLLIQTGDVKIPVFDTTRIHAEAAVNYALAYP
jgi:aspartate racemase